jgi:hypothetical protein
MPVAAIKRQRGSPSGVICVSRGRPANGHPGRALRIGCQRLVELVTSAASNKCQFQPAILLARTSTCSMRGAPANSSPALDIKAEAI